MADVLVRKLVQVKPDVLGHCLQPFLLERLYGLQK